MYIPFNIPYLTSKENEYVQNCLQSRNTGADGFYTQECQKLLQTRYNFPLCLLTTSCTTALEICATLLELQPDDEIIVPSYTFVSTANAFVLFRAKIIFADSETETPNIDVQKIESLITPKTKAIVVVHYAGVACDMQAIMQIANKHNLIVIEDAAQGIDAYWQARPLGSIGHLGAISFDQTKNIQAGVVGALIVNDARFQKRAEIIRTKGTNRGAFFRGEVAQYNWVDVGSACAPSDIVSACLYAQLQAIDHIQALRLEKWTYYYEQLLPLQQAGKFRIPALPTYAQHNAHIFYVLCENKQVRENWIQTLKANGIEAYFHYISLHNSPYWVGKYNGEALHLPQSDYYTDCLLRLPLYPELTHEAQRYVVECIKKIVS